MADVLARVSSGGFTRIQLVTDTREGQRQPASSGR
jgi:hypothetical protein